MRKLSKKLEFVILNAAQRNEESLVINKLRFFAPLRMTLNIYFLDPFN